MLKTLSNSKINNKEIFLNDVLEGLSSEPKKLSSKYFYDEKGDKLFHNIMSQPEYYLTCAEHEILHTQSSAILSHLDTSQGLRIIEPGAGDGMKTKILLKSALEITSQVIYNPIDISPNVMKILYNSLANLYPQLRCEPIVADYLNLDGKLPSGENKKLMLFLGSNLGNFNKEETMMVMQKFTTELQRGDYFLLGVDMVKDPNRILAAYNDGNGVTREFNFNILVRINKELDANFDMKNFFHFAVYNRVLDQAESYLVSTACQKVDISGNTVYFASWEPILTEISRKFTPGKIERLACYSGFTVLENFYDSNRDFCCSLWVKN